MLHSKRSLFITITILLGIFILADENCSLAEHKAMGVGSCASSNCHGSVTAKALPKNNQGSHILGNEFFTWYKFDRHAQSYKTLLNSESKKIAYHLGISEPHKNKLCLDCHTTNIDPSQQGEKFRIDDGIGCESCHGLSEGWLKSHTQSGVSHQQNVENGLVDLKNLQIRAGVCASCHIGDATKEVTHKLYGAGHPRLSFELDTYEAVQPRHWKDVHYKATQGWMYGQLTLGKQQLSSLLRHTNTKNFFPEFANYSCFSCHQGINNKTFLHRKSSPNVGFPTLNTNHLEMIAILLKSAKHSHAASWQQHVIDLKNNSSTSEVTKTAAQLEGTLKSIDPGTLSLNPKNLLQETINYVNQIDIIDLQLAEQIVMVIASINQELKNINQTKIKDLYSQVSSTDTYYQDKFKNSVKNIQ